MRCTYAGTNLAVSIGLEALPHWSDRTAMAEVRKHRMKVTTYHAVEYLAVPEHVDAYAGMAIGSCVTWRGISGAATVVVMDGWPTTTVEVLKTAEVLNMMSLEYLTG